MSSAIRLASLLRTFGLPSAASAADVRRAYLKEAKRLHPDGRAAVDKALAQQEFVELRARFDEALALLKSSKVLTRAHVGSGTNPVRSARREGNSSSTTRRADFAAGGSGASALPVRGLPPQIVYSAVAIAAFLGWFVFGRSVSSSEPAAQKISAKQVNRPSSSPADRGTIDNLAVREGPSGTCKSEASGKAPPSPLWDPGDTTAAPVTPSTDVAKCAASDHMVGIDPHGTSAGGPDAFDAVALEPSAIETRCGQEVEPSGVRRGGALDRSGAPQPSVLQDDELSRDLARYFESQEHRRTKSRKPSSSRVEPQMRDGVAMSQAHVAAEDGRVWWLERCGASSCRQTLEEQDRRWDTPLHRCARSGQAAACYALLRLGVDPAAQNRWYLLPEDLAAHEGHTQLATILRGVRSAQSAEKGTQTRSDGRDRRRLIVDPYAQQIIHHEWDARKMPRKYSVDNSQLEAASKGLGYYRTKDLSDRRDDGVTWDTLVTGVREGGWLRLGDDRYLPMTVQGKPVLKLTDEQHSDSQEAQRRASWRVARRHPDGLGVLAMPPSDVAYDGPKASTESLRHALNMAVGRAALRKLPLERYNPLDLNSGPVPGSNRDVKQALSSAREALAAVGLGLEPAESAGNASSLGLILFEPPGVVSVDAPGHWIATRLGKGGAWRLDSIRGPFRLSATELGELRGRYAAWSVVELK